VIPKRVRLFPSGELEASILGSLRKADGQPLAIVDAIVVRRAKVAKTWGDTVARWSLT
jgi:hypothetical protein